MLHPYAQKAQGEEWQVEPEVQLRDAEKQGVQPQASVQQARKLLRPDSRAAQQVVHQLSA